jgi:hypothetical protein
MCRPIEIPPFYVTLIVCTATLVALVYAEGWSRTIRRCPKAVGTE